MARPEFEYEVRELLDTPISQYKAIQVKLNPFYYFSNKSMVLSNYRKALLNSILTHSEHTRFPYITGDIVGGSGKTFILNRAFEYYANNPNFAVVKISGIVRYRFPLNAVQVIKKELEKLFLSCYSLQIISILDEVEFADIYAICLRNSTYVIAGGHYLLRDASSYSCQFHEIDIDQDWPIPREKIYNHLVQQIEKVTNVSIISTKTLDKIVLLVPNLGTAEFVTGLLIATYARRVAGGKKPDITEEDINFWCTQVGTNWFWFSMDCWRIHNPTDVKLQYAIRGNRSDITLSIDISASLLQRKKNQ